MGALLHSALDSERRAQCQAADEADRLADAARHDAAVRLAREDQRYVSPFWIFGPRRPEQERITHPLAAASAAGAPRRRAFPQTSSRFGDLSS